MSYPSYPGAGGYNQGGGGYGQEQPNYQGGRGYGGGPGGYGAAAGAGGPGGQYNPYQQQYGQQGYGAPPGALPLSVPGISPETQRWFDMVDRDRSGKINAIELKSALVNGKGENFSDNACKLMIGMFDLDHSGTIDIQEFEKLFGYINQWLTVFKTYDRDGSGQIDENELTQALTQMGFRFSSDFVKFLVAKSDPIAHKNISVDQFIVLCVQIQRFTEAFRVRDREQKGLITINFEDFLTVAIGSSI